MGSFILRIVVVFVNKPLTVSGADWPVQLIDKARSNPALN